MSNFSQVWWVQFTFEPPCYMLQCHGSSSGNTSGHIISHARNGAASSWLILFHWLFKQIVRHSYPQSIMNFTYQIQLIKSRSYTFLVPSKIQGILFFIVKAWSINYLFKDKFLHFLSMVGFARFLQILVMDHQDTHF